ncbi:MAG: hypothetical protein JNN07_14005 [Verrucomicrobiales bacterium]|nr:hypothetical protein [Verrucomicrobiales bacterium]
MRFTQPRHLMVSPKVAERIADRSGDRPQAITVRLVGKKDVRNLVASIKRAQKSSTKKIMVLD